MALLQFSPELLIFDLDGTLADTKGDIAACTNRMLENHRFPVHNLETVTSFVGRGMLKLIEQALPEKDKPHAEEYYPELLELYSTMPPRLTRLYQGISRFLKECPIPMALLTNKPTKPTELFLKTFELESFFPQVVCGDSGFSCKPDPRGLLSILEETGTDPASALMIGDSPADIEAAKRAGVPVAVHLAGFTPASVLEHLTPDYLLSTMDQLPLLLEGKL